MIKTVKKLWGTEYWLHNDEHYCMKKLILKEGFTSSMHMHKVKRETFLVIQGKVMLEYNYRFVLLSKGESWDIEPGVYHRFQAASRVAIVIEASTTHDDADVYRKEESKKIEGGSAWKSRAKRLRGA